MEALSTAHCQGVVNKGACDLEAVWRQTLVLEPLCTKKRFKSKAVQRYQGRSPLQGIILDKAVHKADKEIQGRQLIGEGLVHTALRVLQSLDGLVPRQLDSLLQGLDVCLQKRLHMQAMSGRALRKLSQPVGQRNPLCAKLPLTEVS